MSAIAEQDAVTASLVRMARDSYPAVLERGGGQVASLLDEHPALADLRTALQADDVLRSLFPDGDPGGGWRGSFVTSSGVGGSVDDATLPLRTLPAAWAACLMRDATPSADAFVASVARQIQLLREALGPTPPTVRTLYFFTGFRLAEDVQIHTPWGRFRPATPVEQSRTPADLVGAELWGSDDSEPPLAVDGVLEMESTLVIRPRSAADDDAPPRQRERTEHARRVQALILAVLRASASEPRPLALQYRWHWQEDPLVIDLTERSDSNPPIAAEGVVIDQAMAARIETWLKGADPE